MKIFSLVCENGLGHYKRTIAVLDAIRKKAPEVSITVACPTWQIERMNDWEISRNFWNSNVKHLSHLVSPGVHWEKQIENYTEYSLLQWHKRMKGESSLMEADLVLSDNLPQILLYRSDAILLGSFLWSDVLTSAYPSSDVIQRFAEEERSLLAAHKPYMICVGDMVMDGVVNQCTPVRMGWFCSKTGTTAKETDMKSVAVLGGATGSFSKQLSILSATLAGRGITVFLPKEFYREGASPNMKIFDYREESFSRLDAIICRPGIGTITDAVKFGIPVIAAYENCNIEMRHNAARTGELEIGIDLGADTPVERMCELIINFMNSDQYKKARKNITARRDGGINESADWIIQYYKTKMTYA